ncbi:MAG: CpaF family protein [Planctomycetota bacterium JB042]
MTGPDPVPPSEGRPTSDADDELRARALFRRSASGDVRSRLSESRVPSESLPAPSPRRRSDDSSVKGDLLARLLDEISDDEFGRLSEEDVARHVREFVARVLRDEELPLNAAEQERLAEELTEEALGVGPLAPLLADPAITDILVNGPDQVYVERFGRLKRSRVRFRDAEHVERVIQRIAGRVGRRIDQANPMVDLRLPDGSRVNATLPPASIDYPTLSIRRFGRSRLRREDLVRLGSLSEAMDEFLAAAVSARRNLLISGGTGAGKSTLLAALAEAISPDERILTIEDTAELLLDQPHVVRMETRPPNVEGEGRISARDLLVNALRMRPTRIIVGEVRGGEALDMLQAMNTGHDGGLSTVHANSPRDAISRLETMVLMAGVDLPSRAIREQIVAAIDLVVHVERSEDGRRRVSSVSELTGLEGTTPLMQEIFRFERHGTRDGAVVGSYVATGILPRFAEELQRRGKPLPQRLFQDRGRPRDG